MQIHKRNNTKQRGNILRIKNANRCSLLEEDDNALVEILKEENEEVPTKTKKNHKCRENK